MFVVTAGLVLGLVHRRTFEWYGPKVLMRRLLGRSWLLYRALIVVILVVILLARLAPLDMTALTSFTDRSTGEVFSLIPPEEMPWLQQIWLVLRLGVSPHQIQILGLYVVLIALAPLMIQALHHRWLLGYFAVTWGLYALGWFLPEQTRLLGMQWEFAFPILLYQVYFTHALAVGYFRQEIAQGLKNASTRWLAVGGAAVLALAFLLAAQTNPNPAFPDWWRLGSLTDEQYRAFHGAWLAKGHPSPLRLLNVAAFFVAFYALLTYLWVPLNRALGWLLIPLGEASLYVFLMHLAFIALIDQIPGYFDESPAWQAVWPVRIWFNTALYVGTILSLWLMVRHKVLFGVVPR
jgi:hypothetical protein